MEHDVKSKPGKSQGKGSSKSVRCAGNKGKGGHGEIVSGTQENK
jgi:hypothetical protein